MKKNVSLLSIAYFTFLLLIVLSSSLRGAFSEIMYYLAYILPFFAVIIFSDREVPKVGEFALSDRGVRLLLPSIFPTVFVIAVVAAVATAFASLFDRVPAAVNVSGGLIFALFYHALLPSILEELLFRFLPMRYIAPYSRRYAVVFSAVFFALAHHSFFSIPYALFAGALFMTLNLICESSLPSVILHFVNNAVSILWMMYFGEMSAWLLLAVLSVPTVISLYFIFRQRKCYSDALLDISSGKPRRFITPPMCFAAVVSFLVAVIEFVYGE